MTERSEHLQEQFSNPAQQHEAATLAMWVFLSSEVMFFGAMFAGYTMYRVTYPHLMPTVSPHLNLVIGALNTAILMTSSLTMTLGFHAIQRGKRGRLMYYLALSILLGLSFLVLKGVEYYGDYVDHLVPLAGYKFAFTGPMAPHARLFMAIYFVMTGLHALHLLVAVCIAGVLFIMAWAKKFSAEHHNAVEMSVMYWHLVDIVWVFLFPLIYLPRPT